MNVGYVMIAFMLAVLGAYAITVNQEINYAKAGLQQCLIEQGIRHITVWQKECKK